jgi:hypothetical protein
VARGGLARDDGGQWRELHEDCALQRCSVWQLQHLQKGMSYFLSSAMNYWIAGAFGVLDTWAVRWQAVAAPAAMLAIDRACRDRVHA